MWDLCLLGGFCIWAVADSSVCSVAMSICVWGMCARPECVCVEMQDRLRCTLGREEWSVAAPSDVGSEDGYIELHPNNAP